LYTHFATRKLETAHIQTTIPSDTVMKSVGTRTRSAMPIQKREKRRAVMKERARAPSTNERKRATGVKERRNWISRND
jgi:hypothetical protein